MKKYEVTYLSSSQDSIEKPIPFIKNLILKIYHESLLYTQNKLRLQNFKNSPDYHYKIMNISPINNPTKGESHEKNKKLEKNENTENITCMIQGYFQNNSTDKNNKNITNINSIILKLSQTQIIFVTYIFLDINLEK